METETLKKGKIVAVPKLRFREFEENWYKTKLGDFLTFKNGLNSDKEKYGSGIKFINVLDIINNDFITYNRIRGSVEVTDKEIEKNSVSYGDILFQRSSETREEVGQSNVYLDPDKTAVFGGFVIRGKRIRDYNPLFLHFLLKTDSARNEITSKSGGSTRYNVGQETLSNVVITTTSIPEQQKIASFLSTVDKKVQQLTGKKELLETYKKGVMHHLFSQVIRFKDEDGKDFPEWEKRKLGDVIKSLKSGKSKNSETGQIDLYGSTGIIGKCEEISNIGEFILIARVGANAGQINIAAGEFGVTDNTLILEVDELNKGFIFYFLLYFNLNKLVFGSGQPLVTGGLLKQIKLQVPCHEEQQKIAEFLSVIDKKIEAVSNQIEKTQSFKKGLLQQMFV